MMKCKEVNQLLLSYLDDEVSPEQREDIQNHLYVCSSCKEELEALANTLGELRQGLEEIAAGASPSTDAWAGIRSRIAKEERRRSPLSSLRERLSGIGDWGFGGIANLERAAATMVLIGALIVGLLAHFGETDTTIGPFSHPLGPLQISGELGDNPLVKFASQQELEDFVETGPYYPYYSYRTVEAHVTLSDGSSGSAPIGGQDYGESQDELAYSETNIQVEGVDEADIVKTDGNYIYTITDNRVVIVDAYPAEDAEVLSEIEFEGTLEGLYLNEDKLVVLETQGNSNYGYWGVYANNTCANVFDVSNRAEPALAEEISVDGQYWDSRRVGDYVYMVVDKPVDLTKEEVDIPSIYLEDTILKVPAEEILHPEDYAYAAKFTTVVSFNMMEDIPDVEHLGYGTLFLGANSNLYASQENLYITCNEYSSRTDFPDTTAIHRIRFEEGQMEYEASGEVPGRLLNQFSMDEHLDNFRVATTTGYASWSDEPTSWNHLYILDDNLEVVGMLEYLAPGEKIYSARFMGERCYLVTFKEVDPFFVIDVSDPEAPEVLGELKITGYSDYLHPYDDNHIIGIGKETIDGLYQGVKISLFDVTDVSNPTEIDKYEIGDRGSTSPVLSDHKALLFDRSRNLLVLPVSVYETGSDFWQGAYVFDISPEIGLLMRGRISHHEATSYLNQSYWYESSPLSVKRSLYIEEVLYTNSTSMIKMNTLDSLTALNSVDLT